MDYRSLIQQSIDYIEKNLRSELTASELAQMEGCVNEADLLDTVRNWALPVSRQTLGL